MCADLKNEETNLRALYNYCQICMICYIQTNRYTSIDPSAHSLSPHRCVAIRDYLQIRRDIHGYGSVLVRYGHAASKTSHAHARVQ